MEKYERKIFLEGAAKSAHKTPVPSRTMPENLPTIAFLLFYAESVVNDEIALYWDTSRQ